MRVGHSSNWDKQQQPYQKQDTEGEFKMLKNLKKFPKISIHRVSNLAKRLSRPTKLERQTTKQKFRDSVDARKNKLKIGYDNDSANHFQSKYRISFHKQDTGSKERY